MNSNRPRNQVTVRKVARTLKNMKLAPKPNRPRTKQNSPRSRRNLSRPNMSEVHFQDAERLLTVTVPASSTPGSLLALIPVNPLTPPRLQAVARQFDTWHGTMSLEAETTGNAFSKNYVILRHLPNGDPTQVPVTAEALLNTVEAGGRPTDTQRLQLDSNRKAVVVATWRHSYNKDKPIVDPDLNDANNGLFLLVSNGSPGTEPVDVVLRLRYNIRFYGPVAKPLVIDSSSTLLSSSTTLATPWLDGVLTGPGTNYFKWNDNSATLTLPKGRYLFTIRVVGTGLTGLNAAVTTNCFIFSTATSSSATSISRVYIVDVASSGTIRLDQPAAGTTLLSATLYIAPFNA